MNTLKSPTEKEIKSLPQEPHRFTKRIVSIVYEVEIYFNPDTKESLNDKKLRLIRHEMGVVSWKILLKTTSQCAILKLP